MQGASGNRYGTGFAHGSEWQTLPQHEADFAAGATLLRQTSGPVVCENLLLCGAAGKHPAFDPYYTQDQMKLGRIGPQELTELVRTRRLGAVEIGDVDMITSKRPSRFSKTFLQALKQYYTPTLRTAEIVIWVPAPIKS